MSRKQKNNSVKPLVDIVIVTGGRFDMLTKCLNALYLEAETTPISIHIIDNATPAEEYRDNSDLFFKRENSSVCDFNVKHFKQPLGFGAANNEGARMGTAPLIMFLNDDVELHEGAIKKVVGTLDDPSIGAVGIKLIFSPYRNHPNYPQGKVQHIGMALNIRGDAIHPLIGWSPDNPKTQISRDVICVTGACLTVRRNIFNRVGGFSPEYGLGTWEDVDLCFKVRQAGHRVFVNCDATGFHYTNATVEKNKVGYPLQQNRLIFQTKWGQSGLMAWTEFEFF
jgi:GT2 family glycosyltransferase